MSGKEEISKGLFLIETQLGWTLTGRAQDSDTCRNDISNVMSFLCHANTPLRDNLQYQASSFPLLEELDAGV